MALVVGYAAEDSGTAALELAGVLARSTGERLIVAVVVASSPFASTEVEAVGNYLGPMRQWAETVLDRARASLPADLEATYRVVRGSSIPSGLESLVADSGASGLVLGSSSKAALGRISLGSITNRLAHTAPFRVYVAPHGFRAGPDSRITRLSVSAGGTAVAADLAIVANRLAETMGDIDVRAVSFVVRPPKRVFGGVEESADDLVADTWVARIRDSLGDPRLAGSLAVGEGLTWAEAIDRVPWSEGDLLLVGPSSAAGPARLFLGSRASKILRCSPVPVLLIPAGAG